MAFAPRNDWQAGEDYSAARVIELEAAVAANETAAVTAAATAATAEGTANAVSQEVADLQGIVADQDALITALTTRVSDLEAANTALVSRLEALETPAE